MPAKLLAMLRAKLTIGLSLWLLLGLNTPLHASDPLNIDSLHAAAVRATADSARLDALIKIGIEYFYEDPLDSALYYMERVIEEGIRANRPKVVLEAYLWQARSQLHHPDYGRKDWEVSFRQAHTWAEKAKFPLGMATALTSLAEALRDRNFPEDALALYAEVEPFARRHDLKEMVYRILNHQASIHVIRDEHLQAVRLYDRALTYCLPRNMPVAVAGIHGNIGSMSSQLGDQEEAIKHFQLALETYNSIPDSLYSKPKVVKGGTLLSMGNAHKTMGNYAEAIALYQQAGVLFLGNHRTAYWATRINVAAIWRQQGQPQRALAVFDSVRSDQRAMNEFLPPERADFFISWGKTWLAVNQLDSAARYLKLGLSVAQKIASDKRQKNALEGLHQLAAAQGDFQQAYQYHQQYKAFSDSLSNDQQAREIGRLEATMALREADATKKAEKRRQKAATDRAQTIQYYGVTAFLMGLFVVFFMVQRFQVGWSHAFLFLSVILAYEFVIITLDPFILRFSGGMPLLTLLANFLLALCFLPVHRGLERYIDRQKEARPAPAAVTQSATASTTP